MVVDSKQSGDCKNISRLGDLKLMLKLAKTHIDPFTREG